MANINLPCSEFKIPGIPGYTPPFGTKKFNGESLTTEEVNATMMLAYTGSTKTIKIQDDSIDAVNIYEDAVFKFVGSTKTGFQFIFEHGFLGVKIRLMNTTKHLITCDVRIKSPVNVGTSVLVDPGHNCDLTYLDGGFSRTVSTIYGIDAAESAPGNYHEGRDLCRVFGGVTPQEVMKILHLKCKRIVPDYSGIKIGDYVEFQNNGLADASYTKVRFLVSGFNTFYNTGYPKNTKNHILWSTQDIIDKHLVIGLTSSQVGYGASSLRSWLSTTIAPKVEALFAGDTLLYTVSRETYGTIGMSLESEKLFIPTQTEVFGRSVGAAKSRSESHVQFPIFQNTYFYRVKNFRGIPAIWWTQTLIDGGSSSFIVIDPEGRSASHTQSSSNGVVPFFCTN